MLNPMRASDHQKHCAWTSFARFAIGKGAIFIIRLERNAEAVIIAPATHIKRDASILT